MRAREFIREDDEWDYMPTPRQTRRLDAIDQTLRGRNVITPEPAPRAHMGGYRLGPDSPFLEYEPFDRPKTPPEPESKPYRGQPRDEYWTMAPKSDGGGHPTLNQKTGTEKDSTVKVPQDWGPQGSTMDPNTPRSRRLRYRS
jgi:hypothetical protein